MSHTSYFLSQGVAVVSAAPGVPTLPYTPYIILVGDSQPTGSSAQDAVANKAAYAARDPALRARVKAMAAPGANQQFNGWMEYAPATPATLAGSGLRAGAPQANMGPEVGFIENFTAAYANDLYVIKDTLPGAFQGGKSLGTFTGSISGGVLTTAVSGDVSPANYITGPGIPAGTYVANGGGTAFNLGIIGSTATPAIAATGSIIINKFDGGLSFKRDQSPIYRGFNKRVVNGVRQHLIDAIAAVPGTPVCVGVLYWLGTNDKIDATCTSEFFQNVPDFLTQIVADVPSLSGVSISWPRIRGADANSLSVRADQMALKSTIPALKILPTDAYPIIDGTHFNIDDGYRQVGQDWFKVAFQGYAGL